jgi:hypothetical protein
LLTGYSSIIVTMERRLRGVWRTHIGPYKRHVFSIGNIPLFVLILLFLSILYTIVSYKSIVYRSDIDNKVGGIMVWRLVCSLSVMYNTTTRGVRNGRGVGNAL